MRKIRSLSPVADFKHCHSYKLFFFKEKNYTAGDLGYIFPHFNYDSSHVYHIRRRLPQAAMFVCHLIFRRSFSPAYVSINTTYMLGISFQDT